MFSNYRKPKWLAVFAISLVSVTQRFSQSLSSHLAQLHTCTSWVIEFLPTGLCYFWWLRPLAFSHKDWSRCEIKWKTVILSHLDHILDHTVAYSMMNAQEITFIFWIKFQYCFLPLKPRHMKLHHHVWAKSKKIMSLHQAVNEALTLCRVQQNFAQLWF